MNVIILHCHWERGGVTQVAENHIRALRRSEHQGRIVLVGGSRQGGLSPETRASTEQIVIDDFDYDPPALPPASAAARGLDVSTRLARQLEQHGCHPSESVLHWHNHSLGKNTAAPEAIRQLAAAGWHLLLQIHDFAEDNRPENYLRLIQAIGAQDPASVDRYLYPTADQIHYATLTRADASILEALGIPAKQFHCFPNSVSLPHATATTDPNTSASEPAASDRRAHEQALSVVRHCLHLPAQSRWCLYPVRGIRRKNVGEFLLLCRWLPPDMFGGLTLRPTTPVEAASYQRWQQVAEVVSPQAVFDAAHHPDLDFATNLTASDFVLSTSVAEGFGMAFLEPWLAGRGVIARRIPTTTDDFLEAGIQFDWLYDQIPIPGTSAWRRDVQAEWERAHQAAWCDLPAKFRPPLPPRLPSESETIDFAQLTPSRQLEVLHRISRDSGFAADTARYSAPLVERLSQSTDSSLIEHNQAVIRQSYSLDRQGQRLLSIYRAMLDSASDREVRGCDHAGRAMELVAQTHPFYPCRTETISKDDRPSLA